MFFLSNNVEKRNSLWFASFIQHPSKRWSGSSMDNSFFSSCALVDFSHANNGQRVNNTWGGTMKGNVLVKDEALFGSWNCIFTPRSRTTLSEADSLSNPILDVFSISLCYSSSSFESHGCWKLDWEIWPSDSHSIWRVDSWSVNLYKELAFCWDWLGEILKDRRLPILVDNNCLVSGHWYDYWIFQSGWRLIEFYQKYLKK